MARVAGGNHSIHVNDLVSPYSILRTSAEHDVDDTIQKITMGAGPKSTRAQLLRQLALKKKFEQNPFLAKRGKLTKENALKLGEDPHYNDLGMEYTTLNASIYPRGVMPNDFKRNSLQFKGARMRNRRGEYQSIDVNNQ